MNYKEYSKKVKIATFIDFENVNKSDYIPLIFDYLEKNDFIPTPRKLIVSKITQEEKITSLIKNYCLELVVSYKRLKQGKNKKAKEANKNNADFRYYIEVLDTLYNQKDIDAFCIVTSDEDYTELILKLKSDGKYVLGIGNKETTSDKYRAIFSDFIFVEDLQVTHNDDIKVKEEVKETIETKVNEEPKKEEVVEKKEKPAHRKRSSKAKNKVIDEKPQLEEPVQENKEEPVIVKENKPQKEKTREKTSNKQLLQEFKTLAKERISTFAPGKYNLSNITSSIKKDNPKKYPMRISLKLYEDLGYQVYIDNDDKSNAYIIIEEQKSE